MFVHSRRMLAVVAVAMATSSLSAQSDTAPLFRWFDRNQDGSLDKEEMGRMPDTLRTRIKSQGYDLDGKIGPADLEQTGRTTFVQFRSRDDSRDSGSSRSDSSSRNSSSDDRSRSSDNQDDRSQFRSFGGDFGGRDFGGRDFGGRDFGGRDFGGGRDYGGGDSGGRDFSRFGGGRFGVGGDWNRDDNQGDDKDDEKEPKPRITFDLPESFLPGDLDGDGQIAFYEWRRWQRTKISEFRALDRNGDGLLTPRELQQQQAPAGGAVIASPASTVPGIVTVVPGGSPAPAAELAEDDPVVQRAKAYFDALDIDKDGQVTAEEFAKSNRLKGMFEKAGIDLTPSRSLDEFVAAYAQVTQAS